MVGVARVCIEENCSVTENWAYIGDTTDRQLNVQGGIGGAAIAQLQSSGGPSIAFTVSGFETPPCGSGQFGTAVGYTPPSFGCQGGNSGWAFPGAPGGLTIAKLASSAANDLVVNASGRIDVGVGNGSGSFAPPVSIRPGGVTGAPAAADFNGDGKPDLAVGTQNGVYVLMNATDKYFQGS